MKKLFLTLTMLLFAFTGVMRASAEQGNVRADQVIEQGFEDGLGDWTMNHCHSTSGPTSSYGGNTGSYAFRFYYTADYPQYLISPELDDNDGVNLTFYAARYSSNYPETFKVGYSSTTNDPTEFTWDSEVTCTTMYGAGAYEEYSYDFPAGTKYVSIACTSNDQFYLFVDDITVTATEPAPATGELVEVTIGDPTSTTTNAYLPGYTLYDYAISQQIYTADEIGVAGSINTLTMWLKNSSSHARNINVYMKEVEATEFASNAAWVSMSADDMVASFTFDNGISSPVETAIALNTPFNYSGTGNLVICFQDVTGQWSSGLGGVDMDAAGNQALYAYRDGTVFDPSNPGVNGTLLAKKNVIRLSIMTSGGEPPVLEAGIYVEGDTIIDLGYRPNGAWMAPFTANLFYSERNATVEVIRAAFNNEYFTLENEVPFEVANRPATEIGITTGDEVEGPVAGTLTLLYDGDAMGVSTIPVVAMAYNPVEGDVYETAIEVNNLEVRVPFETVLPDSIYKNYELLDPNDGRVDGGQGVEEEADYVDAVYKLEFDHDVLLYAGANSANAKAALYTEDFNGEGGPMADNYYVYEGPEVAPGPRNFWFYYNYTGSYTWLGTSQGGGFYYGYKISAEYIAENDLAGLSITQVETAARSAVPYYCYIFEGGETPFDGDLVSAGVEENPAAGYYFAIDLLEPATLGDEDIWVIFYSESIYAGLVFRYPVDAENAKVWYYNPNADVPQWTTNASYTPGINCHLLDLPTGRTTTLDMADMIMPKGKGAFSEIGTNDAAVKGTPKAMALKGNNTKANMRNRDTQTILEQGFEEGLGEWTMYNCNANTNVVSSNPRTGNYCFRFRWTTDTPQYLISPEIVGLDNGGNLSFYYKREGSMYVETFEVGFSSTTNTPSAFTWGDEVTVENALYAEYTDEIPAGTKYIAIKCTSNDQYYLYIDDITVSVEAGDEPGGGDEPTPYEPYEPYYPDYNAQIDGMYVEAGTYYLVVASDVANDSVRIAYNEVPEAEQAYVVYPNQEESNHGVEAPAIFEWELGNYTAQMQVLLGTQYPPTDVLIDWTDELVASAWATNLEHNRIYFIQVNEKNAAGVITYGEIVGFTTVIDGVEDFTVVNDSLYPGEAAEFRWTANSRDLLGYRLYMNDELVQRELITGTSFSLDSIEYNIPDGAEFKLTAVYNAGESELEEAEAVTVYMTGNVTVSGHVYDIDEDHPVANVLVTIDVLDEYNQLQTYEVLTDEDGVYTAEVLAGLTIVGITQATAEEYGYAVATYVDPTGHHFLATDYYEGEYEDIDIFTHEYYAPVGQVIATDQTDNVLVEWSWIPAEIVIDFETGDFSQGDFENDATYPWTVVSGHDGMMMKSGNGGISSSSSTITLVFEAPADCIFSFDAECMGEGTSTYWDKCIFSLDGTQQFEYGANISGWHNYSYPITAGVHIFTWSYTKDSSVNPTGDYFAVDNITFSFGGAKDNGRSLANYNLLRRDVRNGEEEAEIVNVATGIAADVYSYIDNAWATLPFGEYQWGVVAAYEGYAAADRSRDNIILEEGFEGGTMPTGWVSEGNNSWTVGTGDYSTSTGTHSGSYNAKINHGSTGDVTYLVTPAMDLSTATAGSLTCYYINRSWLGDTDEFGIYYRVNNGAWNELFATTTYHDSYTEATVNLAGFAANYQIGFKFKDHYGYGVALDDIVVTANVSGGGGGGGGGDVPSAAGLSDTIWSNVLDKDMLADVTVYVMLNNGENPEGATVSFGDEYTAVVDETGTAEFVDFRKGDYTFTVEYDGFYTYEQDVLVDDDTETFRVVLEEIVTTVTDLYVSPTGWAVWEYGTEPMPDDPTPGPGPGPDPTPPTPGPGTDDVTVILTTDDVWEDGSGYQMLLDADATAYGTVFPETGALTSYGDASAAVYAEFEYKIPENADGSCNTQNMVCNSSVSITIPAGTYDWVITNPTPGDRIWIASAGGTIGGRYDDFVFEAGNTYEFYVYYGGYNDATDLTVTGTRNVYQTKMDVNTICRTGKAQVSDRSSRAPLYYKVMLDGVYEGETENMFFQHDVEGMEEGSQHVTAVAPVYATGMPMYGEDIAWVEYTWTYTSCEHFEGVEDLTVTAEEDMVSITWNGGEPTPGPGPGPGPQPGTDVTYDFEDGTLPTGWTTIDADGDGYNWRFASEAFGTGYGHNSSVDLIFSQSCYSNGMSWVPLNPDNFLVTAQGQYSQISFFACAQDASYYAEHFGVAVSTTTATPSAFAMVDEWTMTAKASGKQAPGRDGIRTQGNWYEYTVDLSAYAGQNIYVAIRHFNCSDMFYIDIDDVTLTTTGSKATADGEWYMYDDGEMTTGIGTGSDFYWGVMFPAGSYTGNTLTKVANCGAHNDYYGADGAFNGTVTIYNDGATAPANLVATMNISMPDTDQFVEFVFDEPVTIDPTKNLWVVFYNETSEDYVAAACDETTSQPNARWVSLDGQEWLDLADAGVPGYNWMIRAYIEDGTPGPGPGPQPVPEGVAGYAVFRDGELIALVDPDVTGIMDGPVEVGEHEYCVRVVYGGEPDVTLYAMSCPQCETITWDGVAEQDVINALYPNPTTGKVTIEATGMNHITVVSTIGQVVYDADVTADQIELNLGNYTAGLYLVRVSTQSGVSVKRVTVVK